MSRELVQGVRVFFVEVHLHGNRLRACHRWCTVKLVSVERVVVDVHEISATQSESGTDSVVVSRRRQTKQCLQSATSVFVDRFRTIRVYPGTDNWSSSWKETRVCCRLLGLLVLPVVCTCTITMVVKEEKQ